MFVFIVFAVCGVVSGFPTNENQNQSDVVSCPDYGDIEYATVKPIHIRGNYQMYAIHIECNAGYELIGRHKLLCTDGKWEQVARPQCIPQCNPPPGIPNGKLTLEGDQPKAGLYRKGTLASYSCDSSYELTPPESKYRVCEKGIWTGPVAKCRPLENILCSKPKDIINGYYVPESNTVSEQFVIGQRLHFSCAIGYALIGPAVQQCLDNGSWSPSVAPRCASQVTVTDSGMESVDDFLSCQTLPSVQFATMKILKGQLNKLRGMPGTEVEFRCINAYWNARRESNEKALLRCIDGEWIGELLNCVPVKDCFPPPIIANGHVLGIPGQNSGRLSRYSVGSEVFYNCLPGYQLRGSYLLTCSPSGSWEPVRHHPSCLPDPDLYASTSGTLLVSIATAFGVMLILIAVCLVIVCRRRKPWGRQPLAQAVSVAVAPHPTVSVRDSTTALIHDPDRLALIAFADGLQIGQQSGLPSYEEAIRERSGTTGSSTAGLLGYRPHRAHWSTLAIRRGGRAPGTAQQQQTTDTHVIRQSSGNSHSASMRSGSAGDPMGSTDTMTPSEVSTNITLDTVSSHSGSQPASCRAICGSLASFDTNSILNTEGVPLLEENESEDPLIGQDTVSIGVDHRSIADNASFKYRRTSPDLA